MSALFDKLNLKAQREIVVLDAPTSFEAELLKLAGVRVRRDVGEAGVTFGLAFATTVAERDAACSALAAKAEGDAVLWIAYPKGASKRYRAEFNRDSEWRVMTSAGFDTVRMIAIDEDWSALRFRRVSSIARLKTGRG